MRRDPMETRAEHLAWCKQRALELVDRGDLAQAVSSMIGDMLNHPDTAKTVDPMLSFIGMERVMVGDSRGVRKWIEDFG